MIRKRANLVPFPNLCLGPHLLVGIGRVLAALLLLLIASPSVVAADLRPLHPSTASAQPVSNCTEVLTNGGFERADLGWERVAGSSLFSYATNTYVSGSQSLLLGFAGSFNLAATFAVEQLVILPVESENIGLSFYYDTVVEGDISPDDHASFTIYDSASNEILATQLLVPSTDPSIAPAAGGTWRTERFDLTPLAGRSIRVALTVQNDGEPGRLAMYVDDVSILACRSAAAVPAAAQPLILSPPTPQMGQIDSLEACSCSSSLYTCSVFSSWSIAQACFTQCQVTAGYDIHGLDEDGNGIACELELQGIAPLTATATPTATSSLTLSVPSTLSPPLSPSAGISGTLPSVEPTGAPSPSTGITIVDAGVGSLTIISPAVTTTITTTAGTTSTLTNTAGVMTGTTMTGTTMAEVETAAQTLTPTQVVSAAEVFVPAEALTETGVDTGTFSLPGTLVEVGVLLAVGILSLWVAYLAGQKRRSTKT